MKKLSRSGFGAIEALLFVVLFIGLVVVGYATHKTSQDNKKVDSSKITTNETPAAAPMLSVACQESSYKGELYKAAGNSYSFCMPNGWKAYYSGNKASSVLIANQQGITYNADAKPFAAETGGKDGPFPFAIIYGSPGSISDTTETGFSRTGPIASQNTTGTALYHLTVGTHDLVGAGVSYLDPGTKQYLYVFQHGKSVLTVNYNIFPSDADETMLIQEVISSLRVN